MRKSWYFLPWLVTFTVTLASPQWEYHYSPPNAATSPATTTTAAAAGNSNPNPSSTPGGSSNPSPFSSPAGGGASVCDATSTLTDGGYTIMANIWGATPGVGGSQCVQAAATGGSGVAWSTTWNWASGDNIKSFANANGDSGVPCKTVNNITSIPSTWRWSYSTDSIKTDVAYDMFLGSGACSPVGGHQYEVMVWLAFFSGLTPIGYPSSKKGSFTYQGASFDIYSGPNGNINMVYSFYPTNGNIENFSGDLLPFLTQLKTIDGGIGAATLQSVQAGTEVVTGSATFSVSEYSIGGT